MISYKPIGIIRSPFKEPKGTPIQAAAAADVAGIIEVGPEYAAGLKDIAGFSHLILLYHFHLVREPSLVVKPFLDNEPHGIFATRSPARPNAIGFSIVRLAKVEGNKLHIRDVDIIDGTPLIDIKPYVAEFDVRADVKSGWFESNVHKLSSTKDDGRFVGSYEVETRVYFADQKEAYAAVPFLKQSLHERFEWETATYGLDLFKAGKLLRVSVINRGNQQKVFWGCKGPDIGKLYNIRLEQDEEITGGVQASSILASLKGPDVPVAPDNIEQVLASLGYEKFMSFAGTNWTGSYEGVALKLMVCPALPYPVLVEFEKTACTPAEAFEQEQELQAFVARFGLEKRVIKKEPPTLLYESWPPV
ncbi:tRNA (N6-threonylcarbamoyladenosine(37)-N6)-methyltransferase TrmO [Sporomusa aerivorans]|uniref:tRNA (N6-threonylcarbamoyladenosine(37)-N6)-methyltransferase TrmO n=1 Tax=Sporomusa aerivorans TaxID=204936 RepID=UPI00352A3259